MDFNDTPEEAKFREAARAWLAANAPKHEAYSQEDFLKAAKAWQLEKYNAGWACLRWPVEYGGRGASAAEAAIFAEEEAKYSLPTGPFTIGQGMAAPTLMAYATDEQKKRYLPKLASGEEIWCQLFSEPAGGSDLAALRTRSVRDGDDWVINGQKIWTSGAHYSDFGILVTRSDPNVPKHKGLTYFFLSMKSPGVDVKPIKQISGQSGFNEVYFTDVRIPDAQRLGEVGQGWTVSLTTLMNERAAIGGGGGLGFDTAYALAKELEIDGKPAIADRAVREQLADWYCKESGLQFTRARTQSALSRGETPGPENSIGKYVGAKKTQDIASFCMELIGMAGVCMDKDLAALGGLLPQSYLGAPGGRIAGGTDEIMLNIIAERVLGLPQDIRVDKGIPFNEVPTGN
ncbi:MAG: acyl-CoA dehydrogenase family protein [Pseudomonadales bacterium]|nr:acyl-CoA dehydrogenase family protein [Pseudomonadales bacterium]